MDVLSRLDETRGAINVLEHPFYQRWSAGELSAEELATYAAQYRRAVVSLARASELAAEKAGPAHAAALREHAEEETAHVELWEQFARAAGVSVVAEVVELLRLQVEDSPLIVLFRRGMMQCPAGAQVEGEAICQFPVILKKIFLDVIARADFAQYRRARGAN